RDRRRSPVVAAAAVPIARDNDDRRSDVRRRSGAAVVDNRWRDWAAVVVVASARQDGRGAGDDHAADAVGFLAAERGGDVHVAAEEVVDGHSGGRAADIEDERPARPGRD